MCTVLLPPGVNQTAVNKSIIITRCGGGGVTHRPIYPRVRDPPNIVTGARCALAPVWTVAENLTTTGDRFLDSPAHTYAEHVIPVQRPGTISMETMRGLGGSNKCLYLRIDRVLTEKHGESF
jgi:hypothetical protein